MRPNTSRYSCGHVKFNDRKGRCGCKFKPYVPRQDGTQPRRATTTRDVTDGLPDGYVTARPIYMSDANGNGGSVGFLGGF